MTDYFADLKNMVAEEFEVAAPPVKGKKGFDITMIMIVVQAIAAVVSALSNICPIRPDPDTPEDLVPIQKHRLTRQLKRECREEGHEYSPIMLKVGQRVALRSTTEQMKGLKKQLRTQGGF